MTVADFQSIQKFFYNLYLVLKFVWEKPDVAWVRFSQLEPARSQWSLSSSAFYTTSLQDLVSTAFHLIKVSRDAGLWSWSQLWDVSCAHGPAPCAAFEGVIWRLQMFYAQTFAPMINQQKAKEEAEAQKAKT